MTATYLDLSQPCNDAKEEIVFFGFEEDFVEDNVRCIPMIVRFKLDACGIKLKLKEWSRMNTAERNNLATMPCSDSEEILHYRNYLRGVIMNRTGDRATDLPVEQKPLWASMEAVPVELSDQMEVFNWHISLQQWRSLANLQRFALMKLCKPGHENKNFPVAIKEFGLA